MSCKRLLYISAVAISLFCAPLLYAGEYPDTLKLKLVFRQNVSKIEFLPFRNKEKMEVFADSVATLKADTLSTLLKIHVLSGASPEGNPVFNKRIGEERGKSMASYLQRLFPESRLEIDIENIGEDWLEFRNFVETNPVPNRKEILDMMNRYSGYEDKNADVLRENLKKELKGLRGGATWRWLNDSAFVNLRTAEANIIYETKQKKDAAPDSIGKIPLRLQDVAKVEEMCGIAPLSDIDRASVSVMDVPVTMEDTFVLPRHYTVVRRIVLAPRTNLLLPLLNAGAEFPLGKRFSIAGDIYYPWIGYDKANSKCLQAILVDLKVSWWFGQKSMEGIWGNTLTGHALSIGAMCGKYDIEMDYKGQQGEIYGAYLDYGYTFCLGRHCRLGLCVGAGYARIPYRKYTVYSEGGKLIRDRVNFDEVRNWFGPVHAEVTMSFPITRRVR